MFSIRSWLTGWLAQTRLVLGVCLLLLSGAASVRADSLEVAYRIDARLSPDGRHLAGRTHITVTADSPLTELQLLMFPEQLNIDPAQLNDLTFPRVFPGGYSRAGMVFHPTQGGAPLEVLPAPSPPGWAPGTLISVKLPYPSTPGVPFSIEGDFEVRIPKRYGTFGAIHRQVTLAGGWYPTVIAHEGGRWAPEQLPSRASLSLSLRYPRKRLALVDGRRLEPRPACDELTGGGERPRLPVGETCARFSGEVRFPVLAVGKLKDHPLEVGIPLPLYDSRNQRWEREVLERVVRRALTVWKEAGLPVPASPAPLVRAPLLGQLTRVTDDSVLLSERALEVFFLVRRYHEFPVAHALFQAWLQDLTRSREAPWAHRWIADGIAWMLVERYRDLLVAGHFQVVDLIRPLSFLPEFDQMLYAPRFAFANEIYDNLYAADPLSESIHELFQPGPSGRVMFMKLEDQLGQETMRRAVRDYLEAGDGTLFEVLARHTGRSPEELSTLAGRWRRPYPMVNYALEGVRTQRRGERFETTFTLREEQIDRPVPDEPVEVRIDTRRTKQTLTWEGKGQTRFRLETPEPVRRIAVDPRLRLLEANEAGVSLRDDNYWPARRKILFSFVPSSFDLSLFKPQGALALYLTNPHDRQWLALLEAYSDSQVLIGGSVGGFHYFGPYRDSQWRKNRFGAQLVANHRAGNILFGPGPSGETLTTLGVRLSFRHESRLGLHDARSGAYFYAGLEQGYASLTGDWDFYSLLSLAGIKPVALHPRHVLVGRALLDLGFGLPEGENAAGQGLFTLGGASALRGLGYGGGVGNRRWLTTLEYRVMLAQGLDLSLEVARVRGLQAVTFVDIGGVENQERSWRQPYYGYGAGLRLHMDFLGLRPWMLGLDVSFLTEEPSTPLVTLRFNQAF